MNQEHYSKLERMYLKANINAIIYDTTTVKIAEKTAKIGLTISEKYYHGLGAMHGSVYFKLLDDAAFFAVNSIVMDVFVLTTSFNIHLTRPVTSGVIQAIGIVRSQSKNFFIAESKLLNQEGKEIGFGTGSFAKSKIELSEKIGYK